MVKRFYFCLFMGILFFMFGCAQSQDIKSDSCIFNQPSQIVPLEAKGALKQDCFMNLLFNMPKDVSLLYTTEVWQNGVKMKSYVNKWPQDLESDFTNVDSYYSQSISLYGNNILYINAGIATTMGSLSWSDPIELIDMTGYLYKIYEKGFCLNKGERKAISIFVVNQREDADYLKIDQEEWDEGVDKVLTESDFVIVFYVEAV